MKIYPLDIYFVCPGMPFDGDTLKSDRSLGGSESACLAMARELSAIGHKVTVFNRCEKPGNYDGVDYRDFDDWQQYLTTVPCDVAIVQRTPEAFSLKIASKVNILWQHDLGLRRASARFNGILWNVDRVLTVSRWHADQYAEAMNISKDVFHPTRNGIYRKQIQDHPPIGRNRKRLIYTARPERGLDVLLEKIFPELLKRDPELELRIAGYDNTVPDMMPVYGALKQRASEFGDKVKWLGPLSKSELYRQYSQAGAYVYPTPSDGNFITNINPNIPISGIRNFREVSCITVMECAAAGLPFISSDAGALKETMHPSAGVLVDPDWDNLWGPEHVERFCDAVMSVVGDEKVWESMSGLAREVSHAYEWAPVAKAWEKLFHEILAEKNDSKERLARHFLRRSDIMAAVELLREPETTGEKELYSLIRQPDRWGPLLDGPESIKAHYTKIGEGHSDAFEAAGNEPRLEYAVQWLKERPHIKRVLDVGCAHGSYAIHLANRAGVEVVGVDIDPMSIALAKKWAAMSSRCQHPDKVSFYTEDEVPADLKGTFDAVFMFEVLEHVPDPVAFVDEWEPYAKPGGRCLVTVPYGPWEYLSYHTYPYRCHIWEYDLHDLRDLFGGKEDSGIKTMPHTFANDLGEPLGWRWVDWEKSDAPTGAIDMERKLALQAPRQTVSVVMIAGTDPNARPPEDTLHWSLRSLYHIADEIVIGNCGLSEEAVRIIRQHAGYCHKVKLVPCPDPKAAGYETPRNEALKHATQDWIYWHDTDETLLGYGAMQKYLRSNIFEGYGIRQHHFTIDANFNPDRPVRLFRRVGLDGRSPQWFGMIHEHPEKELNEGPGTVVVLTDVNIAHVGYLNEDTRRNRFQRNFPLLQADIKKYPDRLLQKHFIMRDKVQLAKYERERNMGRLSPETRRSLEEVIEMWREHFKGRNTIMSNDSLQFYSEACVLLGVGFEAGFGFEAAKEGLNGANMNPMRVKFADRDDMVKELTARMESAVEPYETEWW